MAPGGGRIKKCHYETFILGISPIRCTAKTSGKLGTEILEWKNKPTKIQLDNLIGRGMKKTKDERLKIQKTLITHIWNELKKKEYYKRYLRKGCMPWEGVYFVTKDETSKKLARGTYEGITDTTFVLMFNQKHPMANPSQYIITAREIVAIIERKLSGAAKTVTVKKLKLKF